MAWHFQGGAPLATHLSRLVWRAAVVIGRRARFHHDSGNDGRAESDAAAKLVCLALVLHGTVRPA